MRPFPYKHILRDTPYAMAFNVAFAIVITTVIGRWEQFWNNFVVSMCIGTIAFLLIDVTRLLLWGADGVGRGQRWRSMIPIVVVSVPLAQVLGSELAGLILGLNLPNMLSVGSSARANGMLMITLLGTVGATVFFAGRERIATARADAAKEKARAESTERQALQSQLQLLQAQIEPHMLFNTLANLKGLISIDPARAEAMLDQLIQYLRATLLSSRAQATTLGDEFALMEAYLGLMSVRMGERLRFSFDLPDALRAAKVPPMLLQPLVENAIQHGLEPKIDGGHISVTASVQDGMLQLDVTDNGLGLDTPSAKAGTQVGVSNTRARLQALFGERASLVVEPAAPQGVTSRLQFPLELP
jgi:signal transduction histidine kinase